MLPSAVSPADWPALRQTAPVWPAVMHAICDRHGLAPASLTRLGTGTNVIFSDGGELVIKLYPPFGHHSADVERAGLAHGGGRLPVKAPEIVAHGLLDADGVTWPYLVMTRLAGVVLDTVWAALDRDNQAALAGALGRLIAELHALPITGLERWVRDWPAWIARGLAQCVE